MKDKHNSPSLCANYLQLKPRFFLRKKQYYFDSVSCECVFSSSQGSSSTMLGPQTFRMVSPKKKKRTYKRVIWRLVMVAYACNLNYLRG
jgi:hypothetical protein